MVEGGRFQALRTLLQQASEVDNQATLMEVAAAFCRENLHADEMSITETAVSDPPATLSLPLHADSEWLHLTRSTSFDEEETAVAEMGAAILAQSPYYRQQQQRRQQQLNELRQVENVTGSTRRLQPLPRVLANIYDRLQKTFAVNSGYIALYDSQTQELSFPVATENGQPVRLDSISSLDNRSLTAWVSVNNKPYFTNDWADDDKPVPGYQGGALSASIMAVPLSSSDELVGVLSLQSERPAAFSQKEFDLLQKLAPHITVSVSNAIQYTTTRHLVEQGVQDYQTAVALRQAIAVIGTSLDPKIILKNLLLTLSDLFVYETSFVFLWQEDRFRYGVGHDYYERPLTLSPTEMEQLWQESSLLAAVKESKDTLILTDSEDSRWPDLPEHTTIHTWMGIPLVITGQVLGVLAISSVQENAFTRHEEWLASTLAAHTAVALQNAYLHQQTQQQLRELGTLYQASAMMTANLDQDFVLQTVVSEMVRAVQVDSCSIFVWDETHQSLHLAAHETQVAPTRRFIDATQFGLRNIENLEQYPIVQRVFETQEIHSLRHDNAYSPHQIALLEAAELKSVLLVPLVRRQKVLGLLALGQVNHPRSFTQSEFRLTQNLAGQASVAIEHARLFAQAQRRIEELSTFHEIVLQLNTPLELGEVLDSITEAALRLVDANNMHIFLYDSQTQNFTYGSALWHDGGREPAVSTPRSDGITMTVVRQAKPVVINDAKNHPLFQSQATKAWGICAIAGFPLKHDNQVIGVFTTTYLEPHTFSEDELLLLNLLADQATVAVKNARLFDESQRRLRDMAALVDMAKQITSNLNLESVLQTTVQILRHLLSARASTITMLSKDESELIVEAAAGISPEYAKARMKLSEGVSGEVVRYGKTIYIRDTYQEPDFLFFDEVVRSLLVVPLIIRDKTRGTLTVDSDRSNAFNESDIQLMTIAAAQVSIAISNARLFEELEERAAELAEAYEELKENDRLKDELVQNVSHELRTPLTFVKGYVDLLMDGEMGLMNPEQQEALQIVASKTDEITRLIDDIMTLQRIDTGNLQLQVVPISELLKTAVAGHALVAEKRNLRIESNIHGDSIVYIDKGRINQVLDNLLGNAIKFSPDGGTIYVTLEDMPNKIMVTVTDEGIGVPQDKLDRIFERFYQIDGSSRRRFGGTGLGLAIVKRIIDAHEGEIWVESQINKGSSFYFTLPKKSVLEPL